MAYIPGITNPPPDLLSAINSRVAGYNTNLSAYNDFIDKARTQSGAQGLGFWNNPNISSAANNIMGQYQDLGQYIGQLTRTRPMDFNPRLSGIPGFSAPVVGDPTKAGIGRSLKKGISGVTQPLNKLGIVGDIATFLALTAAGAPAFAYPLVAGVKEYGASGNLGRAGLSAAGTYLGQKVGSAIASNVLPNNGTIGDFFGQTSKNAIGPSYNSLAGTVGGGNFGGYIGNAIKGVGATDLGSALLNRSFNGSLGSIIGSNVGSNFATSLVPSKTKNPVGDAGMPFIPTKADQKEMPASLASLSTLNPMQQASNLASTGVYGGGQGPQERDYFLNLVNRQMFDDAGNLRGLDTLNPIENSYLKQLGISGYGNSTDLLRQIQGWRG